MYRRDLNHAMHYSATENIICNKKSHIRIASSKYRTVTEYTYGTVTEYKKVPVPVRYATVLYAYVRWRYPLFECFEENDLHMPVDQCGECVGEAEDHRVKKGLFCLYCLNRPTKRVLS